MSDKKHDWHKEVGKRLITMQARIEQLEATVNTRFKAFKKGIRDELAELRDDLLVLIEHHKQLFEVFPQFRYDLDEVKRIMSELLEMNEEIRRGTNDDMFT